VTEPARPELPRLAGTAWSHDTALIAGGMRR
jgi:hypothetical protein